MSWLTDNATTLYIPLGLIAAALVMIWRSNRQKKYLGYAVGVLALIAIIWLLTVLVPTDRKQIESNVHAMADAVVAGKLDDLFKHVSEDFVYESSRHGKMTRKMLYEAARVSIKSFKVSEIRITQFEMKQISRANKHAKAMFKATAFSTNEPHPYPFVTKADFVLEGEQWRLKTIEFYRSVVNTDQKIDPFP